jgi:flagellin-like protein
MKFQPRKGISPIIATLLLIAIAVAASIMVYLFVTGLAGNLTSGGAQQTTERLQMQSYNFNLSPQACACAQQIVQIFVLNSGSAATTISTVYYDGVIMTLGTPATAGGAIVNNNYFPVPSSSLVNDFTTAVCTATNGAAANICFTSASTKTAYATGDVGQIVITFTAAATAGTSHTVKVVSTTGASYIFSVTAGRAG